MYLNKKIISIALLIVISFTAIFVQSQNTLQSDLKITKVKKTPESWKNQLTPKQFYILREKGTEQAFTGKYWDNKEEGIYHCAGCNNVLFNSQTKFKSGTGWPSYYQAATDTSVTEHIDKSYGWNRIEVLCSKCDGHLGHVFKDGPKPSGLRYCINSEALNFESK